MSKKPVDPASMGASPEGLRPPRTYRDLCSTCSHETSCGSRSTPERPILFCELFEVPAAAPTPARAAAPPESPPREQGAAHRGLCVNCDNRHECTTARPEAGVWHCQEYT